MTARHEGAVHRRSRKPATLVTVLLALLALGSVPVALAATKGKAKAKAKVPSTKVLVPLPSSGDISYAVAQVRITGRGKAPRGHAPKGTIFRNLAGGLVVTGSSAQWTKLSKSTHVYVEISRVNHASSSLRNVVFFVVRRRGGAQGPARGSITFTIPNATPNKGSFWVKSISRSGVASVFTTRNAIGTALANWGRYLAVLKLAHALMAAIHPQDVHGEFRSPATGATASAAAAVHAARTGTIARTLGSGVWFAGQKLDVRTQAVAKLIFGTLTNRMAFQAAKESPLAPQFIAKELNNAALAKKWNQIMALLPIEVPDTYAASAQEESKFSKVHAPMISSARVAIADTNNGSAQAALESPPTSLATAQLGQQINVHISGASGDDSVQIWSVALYDVNRWPDAGSTYPTPQSLLATCTINCSVFVPAGKYIELHEKNTTGNQPDGWQGCDQTQEGNYKQDIPAPTCDITIKTGNDRNAYAFFRPVPEKNAALAVQFSGAGSGTVTSSPAGISCSRPCAYEWPIGTKVTLTAAPASGSVFGSFSGCDATSASSCTITLSADKQVGVTFNPTPPPAAQHTLTVGRRGSGASSGSVTSSPAGISCGSACSGSFSGTVTLNASGTPFDGFSAVGQPGSGCDTTSGQSCTLSMGSDRVVNAVFGPAAQLDSTFDPTPSTSGTPAGSVLTSSGGSGGANSVAVQSDGKYVAVGWGEQGSGSTATSPAMVVRYRPDGSPDPGFGTNGVVTLPNNPAPNDVFYGYSVKGAFQPSTGDIIVAGTLNPSSNVGGSQGDFGLVRLKPDGTLDGSFGGGRGYVDLAVGAAVNSGSSMADDNLGAIAVDPASGEIFIVGSAAASSSSTTTYPALAAVDANGNPVTFGTNGSTVDTSVGGGGSLLSVALDGTQLDAARMAGSAGAAFRYVATGQGAGAPVGSPVPLPLYEGLSVAAEPDHSFVVGGDVQPPSGSSASDCMGLTHITGSGGFDSAFGTAGVAELCDGDASNAQSLAVTADGAYIYAGGISYNNTNYTSRGLLARFTPTGQPDAAFGGTSGDPAGATTFDADGAGNNSQVTSIALDGIQPVATGEASTSGTTGSAYFATERFN